MARLNRAGRSLLMRVMCLDNLAVVWLLLPARMENAATT